MITIILLTLILVLYILNFKWKRRRFVKMLSKFPGPFNVPLFGNAFHFLRTPMGVYNYGHELQRIYKGRPFVIWFFHQPFVVVHTPNDAQAVSNVLQKGVHYDFLSNLIGDGLVTANPEKWKRHRHLLNPFFNALVNDQLLKVFNKHALKTIKQLGQEAGTGKMFELLPYFTKLTADIIYDYIMGENTNASRKDGFLESREHSVRADDLMMWRMFCPWLHPNIIYRTFLYVIGCSNVYEKAQSFHLRMLSTRIKELQADERLNEGNRKAGTCLVNVLLNSCEKGLLTDDEMKDEVLTIIYAAMDTTAITLGFTLLTLAMHKNVQDKVYHELAQVFEDDNRMPTLNDLSKLTYLEQCIKETLRLYSITPMMIRHTTEDIHLNDDLVIPSGTDIVIPIILLHHDPDVYPDPHNWNPSNFDADKVANRSPHSFPAFGIGPRTCIGSKFAMLVLKIVLSTILRNFKLSTLEKRVELQLGSFPMRSKNGYKIMLEYRNGKCIF